MFGILMIISLAAYLLAPQLRNSSSHFDTGNIPLTGIIAITLIGCILLLVIAVMVIREHHLYRPEVPETDGAGKIPVQSRVEKKSGVIITNSSGKITYMNRKAQQLTAYSYSPGKNIPLEDVYSLQRTAQPVRRVWKAIPDNTGMMTEQEIVTLLTEPENLAISQQVFHLFDNRGEMKEKIIWFSPVSTPSYNTEKQPGQSPSTEALSPNALHYAQLAELTGDLCWEWDIEQCVMQFLTDQPNRFGYDASAGLTVRQWWRSNIHPEDAPGVHAFYTKAIEERKAFAQIEYRFKYGNGKYSHILDRIAVVCNKAGEPVLLKGVMQDITAIKLEEKRVAEAVLNAQEEERKIIGGELHDNINQILATSVLHLGILHEQANHPAKVREIVRITKGHTMKAIDELRKLSHELSPVSLDDTDLEEYMCDLLSSFNADGQFEIGFNLAADLRGSLSDEMQLHFYRILQEQLKNIRKHADADKIIINMSMQEHIVELVIADNGKGFDPLKPSKGIGLANIKRRAHAMGGCVKVQSSPGKGCQLRVKVSAAS